jgi:hypothetical protein
MARLSMGLVSTGPSSNLKIGCACVRRLISFDLKGSSVFSCLVVDPLTRGSECFSRLSLEPTLFLLLLRFFIQ